MSLFELMGCASCQYRMRAAGNHGCYKFGLTKREIDKGAYIDTLKDGSFTLSKRQQCPHSSQKAKR